MPPTTESVPTTAAPPRKGELRSSLWCVDKHGDLGMIAEINSGIAMFYYEKTTLADGEAPCLQAKPVNIALDQLRQAPRDQLPERLGFTEQQLDEYGYE